MTWRIGPIEVPTHGDVEVWACDVWRANGCLPAHEDWDKNWHYAVRMATQNVESQLFKQIRGREKMASWPLAEHLVRISMRINNDYPGNYHGAYGRRGGVDITPENFLAGLGRYLLRDCYHVTDLMESAAKWPCSAGESETRELAHGIWEACHRPEGEANQNHNWQVAEWLLYLANLAHAIVKQQSTAESPLTLKLEHFMEALGEMAVQRPFDALWVFDPMEAERLHRLAA